MKRIVDLFLLLMNGALVGFYWDSSKWILGIIVAIFINSLLMVISDYVSELITELVVKSKIVRVEKRIKEDEKQC